MNVVGHDHSIVHLHIIKALLQHFNLLERYLATTIQHHLSIDDFAEVMPPIKGGYGDHVYSIIVVVPLCAWTFFECSHD